MDWKAIKKQVTVLGLDLLTEKIQLLEKELDLLKESAAADTKSSMGDKYETGREMIQQERNKINTQLGQLRNQEAALRSIDLEKEFTTVKQGALVVTHQMNYYLSTGLGEVKVDAKVLCYRQQRRWRKP